MKLSSQKKNNEIIKPKKKRNLISGDLLSFGIGYYDFSVEACLKVPPLLIIFGLATVEESNEYKRRCVAEKTYSTTENSNTGNRMGHLAAGHRLLSIHCFLPHGIIS